MEVIKVPDERLRAKTKPIKKITPSLLVILKEMEKVTQSFKDPEGVGLAATQIGESDQYFIFKRKDDQFHSFINPKILKSSKKTKKFFEGCLSIPNYWGEIERPIGVTVSYLNKEGKETIEKLTGSDAWFFQHEFDHIQGKLFVDLVLEQKARLFKVVGKDRTGAEIYEEVKLEI